jgi:glutamate racemase
LSANHNHPIGVFDSGVGGLSVIRAIRQQLPGESILFLSDQAHVPYGPRPLDEVRLFAHAITRFLLEQGAKLIVVACNAASAAALQSLRQEYPAVPIVGMEPAVKPAVGHTRSGVVGVLATPATFQGALYASVMERFAQDVRVLQDTCPGLVGQIELGRLQTPKTRRILQKALEPMLAQGIDTVVLGCTHYPFVIPLIEEIAGPGVRVIDPAPAVARQVVRLLAERGLGAGPEAASRHAAVYALTTGRPEPFRRMLPRLLGEEAHILPAQWQAGGIHIT